MNERNGRTDASRRSRDDYLLSLVLSNYRISKRRLQRICCFSNAINIDAVLCVLRFDDSSQTKTNTRVLSSSLTQQHINSFIYLFAFRCDRMISTLNQDHAG